MVNDGLGFVSNRPPDGWVKDNTMCQHDFLYSQELVRGLMMGHQDNKFIIRVVIFEGNLLFTSDG